MALGALAVATTAMGVAGCSSDDGGDTIVGSSSIPVITGLSHPAVLTNGQTPAGAAVRLQIRGDDFDKNAEVILLAKAPATLSATAANLTSGIAGVTSQQSIRIPAANRQWQSQNRIDILTLPASPLAAANLQGTVIVQVINPGGIASTDGTPDGSGTADELTYYADTGLQVTVAQSGPLAGAWANIYPGQNGVEYTATITNMTLEPINTLALTNRSLNFGTVNAHALSYVVQEPATTLAVGASTTARFVAGFSNELPEGAVSASCGVTAVGASSGRGYTGTGGAVATAGSTPTINTRGGNLALSTVAGPATAFAGNGGNITITSEDGGTPAAEGGVTLGTAVAVNATNDALSTTATETPVGIKTTLVGASPVTVNATGVGTLVLGGTIELPAGARQWDFNNNLPVVFRNVTIRFGNTVAPNSLTINAQSTIQFINCTIDLRDQRSTPSTGAGALIINGCTNFTGTVDVQNCTFRTNGIRGQNAALAAAAQTIQTTGAAAASPITIFNSTLDASGAGMVQANLALPIAPTGTDTTPGQNVTIATVAGPVRVDGQSVIKTSGGSMIAVVGNAADVGAKPAGAVSITVGSSNANRNDLTFNGRIEAKGGDALNTVHTTAVNRPNGGNVTIVARKVNVGNAAGRPVLLSNGGSNSLVGNLSLVGATLLNGGGGAGGNAGTIHFLTGVVQEGPFQMTAGSGLIAIGGGGDFAGGTGGAISFGVDQRNEATLNDATAQTVTMAGVVDSSGGWVRGAKANDTYAAGEYDGGDAGSIVAEGNTNVTISGVVLALGGSPARSGNSASPVRGANLGGPGGAITIQGGMQTGGGATADVGHLTVSGIVSSRGGHYTLGLTPPAAGAGGAGNTITLAGERLTVTSTGKVVSDGGSCADVGQLAGGRAGQIALHSGIDNPGLGITSLQAGALAADTTNLLMQGLVQADGGDVSKGAEVISGRFTAARVGTTPGTTITVTWPSGGVQAGDLVTVSGGNANVTNKRVTGVTGNDFTYEADAPIAPSSFLADITVTKQASDAHGGSNSVLLRQSNVAKVQLTAPSPADRVEVTGTVFARAGKVRAPTQPGRIVITGSQVDTGTAGQTDGGNVLIAQTAVITAAGFGTTTANEDVNVTLRTEDAGVVTVNGKVTVDNDRPGQFGSGVGNMLLTVLATPTSATGSIVVNSTGELLVSGGHAGTAADSGQLRIENLCTGPITLTPAFIRSEDQTVDVTSTTGGKGGRIVIRGEGAVNHSAGEITARGTGSAAGHGGQIEFEATGNTTTSVVSLSLTGVARVDGGGPDGWGGRIQIRAETANAGGANPAIAISGTYALSADGSGRGGGGLPTAQSSRGAGGFGGAAESNGNGGIYIGGVFNNAANTTAAVTDQIVTLSTSTTISAKGGSFTGARNANGTPANGCIGGVIVLGDTTTAPAVAPLGALTINSGLDVSGGSNAAGPGGSGGQITVNCNSNATNLVVAGTTATTWSANGGATTFPQSTGGPAGNIVVLGAGTGAGTMAFGATGVQFRASLVGGGGTTVGGDAGVFQVTQSAATTGAMTFTSSTVSITGGTGSIVGANGVVRLIATNAAGNIADTFTGTPAVLAVTGLTVEPANGAANNPVQTLFVQD